MLNLKEKSRWELWKLSPRNAAEYFTWIKFHPSHEITNKTQSKNLYIIIALVSQVYHVSISRLQQFNGIKA